MNSRLSKIARGAGKALLTTYLASQAFFRTADAINVAFPTAERAALNEAVGVTFVGKKSSVEWNPQLSKYLAVLNARQTEGRSLPSRIIFEDKPWYVRDLVDQLDFLFTKGHSGVYDPFTNDIILDPKADASTLIHELGHFDTMWKLHGALGDSISAIAVDENGKSLYRSSSASLAYYLRFADNFVSDSAPHHGKYEEYGFPSDYAQINVYEHVAELIADLSKSSDGRWLADSAHRSERIVELLANEGLFEKGFIAARRIGGSERVYYGVEGGHGALPRFIHPNDVLRQSDSLLAAAPGIHSWSADLHLTRAKAYGSLVDWEENPVSKRFGLTPRGMIAAQQGIAEAENALRVTEVSLTALQSLDAIGYLAQEREDMQLQCAAYTTANRVRDRLFSPAYRGSGIDNSRLASTAKELFQTLRTKTLDKNAPDVVCFHSGF